MSYQLPKLVIPDELLKTVGKSSGTSSVDNYKSPTTITLGNGEKKSGYIQNDLAYLDNGSRIPENASVVTGGGEYKRQNGQSLKISNKTTHDASYSKQKQGPIGSMGTYQSRYWDATKFYSKDGETHSMNDNLLKNVDDLNDLTDGTLSIHSAYRSPARNAKVGGAKNSYHMKGMAIDISSSKYSPAELKKIAENMGVFGGIGIYSWGIHVDVGPSGRRW